MTLIYCVIVFKMVCSFIKYQCLKMNLWLAEISNS